ncbi:MAG: insulinase family protein, partial [Bacteroidetes bacterium]|nr:insulinase family protein [Bacteroidota bacterium]
MVKYLFMLIILAFVLVPVLAQLPSSQHYTLKNGLEVDLIEYGQLPATSIHLFINTGKKNEVPGQQSLAEMTAQAILLGNKKFDRISQDELFYQLGTSIGSNSNDNFTHVQAQFLNEDIEKGFELFSAAVLFPAFETDEIAQLINEEADFNNPSTLDINELAEYFSNQVVYGTANPLGRTSYPGQIRKLPSKTFIEFYQFSYTPMNSRLVICGKLEHDKIKELVEKHFGQWKAVFGEMNSVSFELPAVKGRDYYFVNKKNAAQAALAWTKKAPSRSKDLPAFILANRVFQKVLFEKVREEGGKTYGISSDYSLNEGRKIFRVYTQTRTAEMYNMLGLFEKTIAGFHDNGISQKQLDAAKLNIMNSALSIQSPAELVRMMNPILFNKLEKAQEMLDMVEAVDLKMVNKVISKYYNPDHYKLVIVGDELNLNDQLAKINGLNRLEVSQLKVD